MFARNAEEIGLFRRITSNQREIALKLQGYSIPCRWFRLYHKENFGYRWAHRHWWLFPVWWWVDTCPCGVNKYVHSHADTEESAYRMMSSDLKTMKWMKAKEKWRPVR